MTVEHVWAGALTNTSIRVRARITGTSARLAVSLLSDLSSPVYFGPDTATADKMVTLDATGLTADTRYYYAIEDTSVLDTAASGTFRTQPVAAGEIASYTFGAAGDAGLTGSAGDASYITSQVSNNPVFDTMRAQALTDEWVWFSHLGDLHYRNIATATAASYRSAFNDNFTFNGALGTSARQGLFFRNVASTYTWDDHDFGPNNSDRTSLGNATANSVYRERAPHYTLPGGSSGIYQSWQCGRVLFVQLDCRTFRDPNANANILGKTMLGSVQKAWLESTLAANAGGAEALVLISSSRWIGGDDTWSSFFFERNDVVEILGDTGWMDRMVLMTADEHSLSFGSGPYNSYGRFPTFMFASMDADYGTASREIYDVGNLPGRQQYGTVDVIDRGHTIQLKGTGWVNGVEWMNYSKYVDVGSPSFQVNYEGGQVYPPFEPVSDDQNLTNSVSATRIEGSTATYEREDGPLSIEEPPVGVGVYEDSVTLNVANDSQLPGQAGWRVHVGTVNAYRYPSTTLKLHGSPELVDEYLGLTLGDKLEVLNPPAWLPPGDIQMLTEGLQENFGWFHWDVAFNSGPGEPWTVGELPIDEGQTIATEDFEDASLSITVNNGGDLPWLRTNTQAHAGTWSFRSGAISNNQTSDAIVTVPTGAKTLSFWYRTSSEAAGSGFLGDRLTVLVGSTQVLLAQGLTNWTQFTVSVDGASTVTFRYAKDNSATTGEDAVYIDDVVFSISIGNDAGTARPNRADTTASELLYAATDSQSTLTVITPQPDFYGLRMPWMRSDGVGKVLPDHFPMDVELGGEIVEVASCEPISWDSFNRTFTSGWGIAPSGSTWTLPVGTAANRAVTPGTATVTMTPVTTYTQILPDVIGDFDVVVQVASSQTATGAGLIAGLIARYTGTSDFYVGRLAFGTGGTVSLSAARNVTNVGASTSALYSYSPGDYFNIRMRMKGHRMLMRVWRANPASGNPIEPTIWHLDRTFDTNQIASGSNGIYISAFGGNTNTNPVISVRNYQVENVQVMNVIRGINGITKAHDAETSVALARSAVAAL